jgi:signal transduction histidine kinase
MQIEYRERAPAVANRLDRYSRRIEDRIEQLRQMTNNFLKFVDVDRPVLRRVSLNDLVRAFADSLGRTLPPDIRVVTRLAPDLPPVHADADQVHAALDNLTANAVNAMPEGGVITLATAPAPCARPGEPPIDGVALEVLDTGVGIAEAVRPHLFEAGVSGTEGGSGLGLAIVRKIVTDHGGTIAVSTEAGIGSAFTVVLPAVRATAGAQLEAAGS